MRLLEKIAERFRAPVLMERMFARFGIGKRSFDDPLHGAEALRGAALRCMTCGKTGECGVWLDEAESAVVEDPPPYCRNIHLIRRLRREAGTLH